ncbi:MAG: hypothetical protein N2560_09395 [Ignavibacteria bacterium]|nr:hypothetical protein [Ignavibacteria bacterium]
MKKNFVIIILLLCGINLKAEESFWASNLKSIFGEVGWSNLKLSAALGFRFWNIGVSMGLTGFAAPKPKYIYPSTQFPLPKLGEYEDYKFTYVLVTTDFYYFFEVFDDFIITPNIGFYVQQDSILARSLRTNIQYDFGQLYYTGKTENKVGLNFGLGIDYYYLDNYFVGIGYNLRRGIFIRFAYYWF